MTITITQRGDLHVVKVDGDVYDRAKATTRREAILSALRETRRTIDSLKDQLDAANAEHAELCTLEREERTGGEG